MIGILNAYHFDASPGNYQEDYNKLILEFVQKIFPDEKICNYKMAFGEWPKSVNECRAWFVTGSAKGVYDTEPWISELKKLIIQLDEKKIKLIGICFGHQMIAESLGGRVEKSPHGWGVGVKTFEIVKKYPWMQPEREKLSLLFSHQDQVAVLPPQAVVLASDSFCPYQIIQIGNHILTFQGHPEFSVPFAKGRLTSRKDKIAVQAYDAAMASFNEPRGSEVVVEWIRKFVLSN